MQHLMLIDASGFAHRAYHSFQPRYRERDGLPTGAILGFVAMIWKLLGEAEADPATHIAAIFDAPGKTFRSKIYPEYKSNREPARRTELNAQFPYIRHAADTLGLACVEAKGFEADDVIATLAARADAAGMRVTIVSSDKDYGQCVSENISIVDPMKRERMTVVEVVRRWKVEPAFVPHVQALCGDSVDGIPGIEGVGKSRASQIIKRFTTVQNAIANVEKISWPMARVNLKEHADDAITFLKLTTLRKDVPLKCSWDDLVPRPVVRGHLKAFMADLEAAEWFEAALGLETRMSRSVPQIYDPYKWWREELAAGGQPIPKEPQCGFYETHLVRNGPNVGVRVWREPEISFETGKPTGCDILRCEIAGKLFDPFSSWATGVYMRRPVREGTYKFMSADLDHAKKYRPCDPMAHPEKAIDPTMIPTPKFGRKREKP